MLVRIVRMEFELDKVDTFREIFSSSQDKISSFEGCKDVLLYQDSKLPNVFYTHSIWVSEEHLDKYRNSDFFKATWENTKKLFKEKPKAYSLVDPS